MKKYIILLLVVFLAGACTSSMQRPTVTLNPGVPQNLTSSAPANTTVPTGFPVSETPSPTPCLYTPSYYNRVGLACETYVETTWGSGPAQWGDPMQSPAGSHDHLSPLAFDAQSKLYFSDYVNHRLLKYNGHDSLPVQVIPLPEYYFSDPMFVPWGITITQSSIIIPHGVNKVGILSLDGTEVKDVELPYSFNFMAPGWHPAWVDARGGLLVNGEKVVYFDIGWEDGKWQEVSQIEEFIIDPYSITNPSTSENYIIGRSRFRFESYLYKVDLSKDFLKFRIGFDTGLDLKKAFIGADQQGWVYYMLQSDIARYPLFALSGWGQIGAIPGEISSYIIQSSISPNGMIYLIVYDREDATVQPKIVKCRFPDD